MNSAGTHQLWQTHLLRECLLYSAWHSLSLSRVCVCFGFWEGHLISCNSDLPKCQDLVDGFSQATNSGESFDCCELFKQWGALGPRDGNFEPWARGIGHMPTCWGSVSWWGKTRNTSKRKARFGKHVVKPGWNMLDWKTYIVFSVLLKGWVSNLDIVYLFQIVIMWSVQLLFCRGKEPRQRFQFQPSFFNKVFCNFVRHRKKSDNVSCVTDPGMISQLLWLYMNMISSISTGCEYQAFQKEQLRSPSTNNFQVRYRGHRPVENPNLALRFREAGAVSEQASTVCLSAEVANSMGSLQQVESFSWGRYPTNSRIKWINSCELLIHDVNLL